MPHLRKGTRPYPSIGKNGGFLVDRCHRPAFDDNRIQPQASECPTYKDGHTGPGSFGHLVRLALDRDAELAIRLVPDAEVRLAAIGPHATAGHRIAVGCDHDPTLAADENAGNARDVAPDFA